MRRLCDFCLNPPPKKKQKERKKEGETQLPTPSTRAAKHSIRNSLAASPEEAFDLSSWHNNNQACRVKCVHLFITLPQMHDVAAGECCRREKHPTSPSTRPLLNLSNPPFSCCGSIFFPPPTYLLRTPRSTATCCLFLLL